ncbi:NAD(P)H-dependent oxidoreductase [Streptomyces sp. B1866]|uniref:NAD(P)H-dependent oxidoreductase n=1 Tax=Streptomyces sp. B1866 TaxID=3075431 RepID=UPI00288D14CF|nr:NAD(P)H-dependent oxidoreductase [Streptomyces sp. B1866]MDT3399112.1 NAD(P)H-dependent oxidoreductase [Streptomyces sp. B1866]
MSTLVLLAHPRLAESRVNAALADAVRDADGVTLHDLYAAYPDLGLDVDREQRLLREHDRIVLQFPLYWYSVPPLLKKWLDEVLLYGFAYGTGGTALHGKSLLVATSVGGPEEVYRSGGPNRFTLAELLRPLEASAHFVGAAYQEPFAVYGTLDVGDEALAGHARRYRELLAPAAEGERSLAAV